MNEPILKTKDLKVYYKSGSSLFNRQLVVKAVNGVTFDIYKGETFGLVGESGSGKSTTGKAIAKLEPIENGEIYYNGKAIHNTIKRGKDELGIQMIFQDSHTSLNPRLSIEETIKEPLNIQKIGTKEERKEEVLRLLQAVGLNENTLHRFPHEFSGGQRQRICIARTLALKPDFLICDEPVSALDVSIQAQILNLMKDLQVKYNMTYLFITHDLSVVYHICDRVAVMYLGKIVELASTKELFKKPLHPYTMALMESIPIPNPEIDSLETEIKGEMPSPIAPPSGCVFHTRCPYTKEICIKEIPKMRRIENREVACHLLGSGYK